MEILAARLKWLRDKERYTQSDIATEVGMTVSGYQKIEYAQRDPKIDVLLKLADKFNVSTDFLLGRIDETDEVKDKLIEVLQARDMLKFRENEFMNYYFEDRVSQDFKDRVNNQLQDAKAEYKNSLSDYVKEILVVPHRDLDKSFIRDRQPLYITIDFNMIMDTYPVYIADKKGDEIAHIGFENDIERAKDLCNIYSDIFDLHVDEEI